MAHNRFITSCSDQAEQTPQDQRKFLVFESNLRELLAVCRICHKPCQNDFKVLGSMVRVNSKCPDPTCPGTTWQSQPLLGDKAAGNVLLAAAILFSGCPVAASLRALQSIKIQTITERTYFNYQRGYLLPAVKKVKNYGMLQLRSVRADYCPPCAQMHLPAQLAVMSVLSAH